NNQQKMIDKFNNSHTIREILPGAFVMARDPVAVGSMSPSKDGPFKVTRRTAHGAYELQDLTGEVLPRHYAPEQLEVVTQDLDAQSDESYEVQSIVDHKVEDGAVLYKVHWKGYSDDEDSFIPHSHFDSDKLIHEYWKRINQTNPHVVAKKQRKLLKTQKEELMNHLANTKTSAMKKPKSSKSSLSKVA
ncbi:histone H3-K9 methyltransferase KMT1, partial [Mortierella alpina]